MIHLLTQMFVFLSSPAVGADLPPTPAPLCTLAHEKTVTDMAFNPNGTLLAAVSRSSRRIFLWQIPGGKCHAMWEHPVGVDGLAWSPDGKRLAVTGIDGSLHVYKLKSRQARVLHPGDAQGKVTLHHGAMTPDGRFLVTGHRDDGANLCRLRVWDMATGKEHHSWPTQTLERVFALVAPDGRTVLTIELPTGKVRAWDLATGRLLGVVTNTTGQHDNPPVAMAVAPGTNSFIAGCGDSLDLNALERWILPTTERWLLLGERRYPCFIRDIALTRDGRWLVVSLTEKPRRLTMDKIAKVVNKLDNPERKTPIPDDHLLRFFDLATGRAVSQIQCSRPVRLVRLDHANRFLTAASGELIFVWEVQAGSVKQTTGR
jgi:WD40 repeat protein